MILSAQSIRRLCLSETPLISPFHERGVAHGMTYGLSPAGYDIRIAQDVLLSPGDFTLASAIERFILPADLMMEITDKSSLARRGMSVFNTRAEPGWRGFLTLELVNNSQEPLHLRVGSPVAQAIFHRLDEPTQQPYSGRYQDQEEGPQSAMYADAWAAF